MKWIAFLLLCSSSLNTIVAQPADSLKAVDLVDKSAEYLGRGQADSAVLFHRQALEICSANNYWMLWMKSHIRIAYSWYKDLNQPFVGLDLLEQAIQHPPHPPSSPAEWEQMCFTHLNKAFIYEDAPGDFLSAKREYEQAFQIFTHQLGGYSHKVAAFLYFKYANLNTRMGDYERALNLFQSSIEYEKRYQEPNIVKYGDMAIALVEIGKNEEALEAIKEGLLHLGTSVKPTITLRMSEAEAYLNLGNMVSARSAVAKIPGLIQRLKKENSRTQDVYYWSGYYETLAAIENAAGKYAIATAHQRQAIKFEIETWGTPHRREVGKKYALLGELYLRQNQPAKALEEFQQSLLSVLPKFKPSSAAANPVDTFLFAENTLIEALYGKAKAFRALGQLDQALECFELIPIVEAKLRATHAYESSSLLALGESRHRFDEAISIAWLLYERSIGNRSFADRAFRLTEQARGMLLLQSLAQAQAKYQLPDDIRQRENELNTKIAWYIHEIATERELREKGEQPEDSVRLPKLERELLDLKQELEKFKTELRQRFPDYAALSDEIYFLKSEEVPSLLREDQALVDYYLTEEAVYVFSFDAKDHFYWRKAALPAGFRGSVAQFVEYLQQGNEEDKASEKQFRLQANQWYELLVAPELNRLMPQSGSLIIVPDDALVFVPFEVLLRRPATTGNWRDLPWLLADYNTGYAYSTTLLQMQQTISRKHRESQQATRYVFGGFAPSYSTSSVYKLTSTELLVNNVKKMLGGKTWCNADASEENFKKIAPECRVLLLAMHGLADADNPDLSRLLFGDPLADSLENDNVLYASELQIMQLQADLAVLSACHSGFGKLQKGEGVFSLARAFARAGVPATVMSLWLLHENTAAPLVQSFLQYLQLGKSKDEALRLAKLDFLRNDKNFAMAHPFFWAGVTTSGDMCPLELPSEGIGWWWFCAGLGIAVATGFFFWRKKQRALDN